MIDGCRENDLLTHGLDKLNEIQDRGNRSGSFIPFLMASSTAEGPLPSYPAESERFGFNESRVKDFMFATIDHFVSTTGSSFGYGGDANRVVQAWCWYSLDDDNFQDRDPFSVTLTGCCVTDCSGRRISFRFARHK